MVHRLCITTHVFASVLLRMYLLILKSASRYREWCHLISENISEIFNHKENIFRSQHCGCWWPSTSRCKAICRQSEDEICVPHIKYIQDHYLHVGRQKYYNPCLRKVCQINERSSKLMTNRGNFVLITVPPDLQLQWWPRVSPVNVIRKSLASDRASKWMITNMYIARARCESQLAVGLSGLNARWS